MSLAIVSFMELADSNNGTHPSPRDIAKCVTVSDLLQLAKVEPVQVECNSRIKVPGRYPFPLLD